MVSFYVPHESSYFGLMLYKLNHIYTALNYRNNKLEIYFLIKSVIVLPFVLPFVLPKWVTPEPSNCDSDTEPLQ